MKKKITLCLHALCFMYPLTAHGSETPQSPKEMMADGSLSQMNSNQMILNMENNSEQDQNNDLEIDPLAIQPKQTLARSGSTQSKQSLDHAEPSIRRRSIQSPSKKRDIKHEADTSPYFEKKPIMPSNESGSSVRKSHMQPQYRNGMPSSQVERTSSNSGQVMIPTIQKTGIMTPKSIPSQETPESIDHQILINQIKQQQVDQENPAPSPRENTFSRKIIAQKNQTGLGYRNTFNNPGQDRNVQHDDKYFEDLASRNLKYFEDLASRILSYQVAHQNKQGQSADRTSPVIREIDANLQCTDCLKCPVQDLILRAIGSYNEDILKNATYVRNMRNPYLQMMKDGWTVLKASDKDIKEKAQEYLQEVSEYLHMYNVNGIRGDCNFKAMINDAIIIKNILCAPDPKPKGVVDVVDDELNQPDPEMTRRIVHWTTKASNKIIEFGQENLKTNTELDKLYYASLDSLSALQQKSTEVDYNNPDFVDLKTETNNIFNQLEAKSQELGLEDDLLAKARQKIMNIGGDKKDNDLCLFKNNARSATNDVNNFLASKKYYRNNLQDDAKEITIKIPQGRKLDIN